MVSTINQGSLRTPLAVAQCLQDAGIPAEQCFSLCEIPGLLSRSSCRIRRTRRLFLLTETGFCAGASGHLHCYTEAVWLFFYIWRDAAGRAICAFTHKRHELADGFEEREIPALEEQE